MCKARREIERLVDDDPRRARSVRPRSRLVPGRTGAPSKPARCSRKTAARAFRNSAHSYVTCTHATLSSGWRSATQGELEVTDERITEIYNETVRTIKTACPD